MLLKNKIEIEEWLNQYKVKNYILIPNDEYGYVVNVNSNVSLYNKGLKSIDVKFNKIDGYFDCGFNYLTSLLGCPENIEKSFDCSENKLNSLEWCPKKVGGNFFCNGNKLISLVGSPEIINKNYYCYNNLLKTLEGCPKIINGHFNCSDNELELLTEYMEIKNELYCQNNKLEMKLLKKLNIDNIQIKSNKIFLYGNEDLGDLKNIEDFNELKKIVKIYQEKEKLDLLVNNKDYNIFGKEITDKSLVEKINKI